MVKHTHKCGNTECTETALKDKYGNYKHYCSDTCKKIGTAEKFRNTYATKDMNSVLEKRKATNIKKYGVANVAHTDFVRDKLRITTTATASIRTAKTIETNLINHGVASTNSLQSVKDKKKESFIEKYGVDHQLKIPEVAASVSRKNTENAVKRLAKAAITNVERYGCENPSSNADVKQKRTDTMVERFGVENASQNAEVHAKKMKSQYRTKEFVFPSGNVIRVQGYEPQALTELLKTYSESELVTDTLLKPRIAYTEVDGSLHIYFPDIYIPKDNLLIEVKSQYTYNGFTGWYETNMRKQQGSIDAGYNFKFMIMAKK
jgi:hypothetical protein